MKTETRGRKSIPDDEKKIPITIFVKTEFINKLGGKESLKQILTNYLKTLQNVTSSTS